MNPQHPIEPSAPPGVDSFASLEWERLIERYQHGLSHFHPSLLQVSDEDLDTAFKEGSPLGRWSVRTLLGHLADVELVFVQRMRRMVAEDGPMLSVFDHESPIDAGLYQGPGHPIAGFLAVLSALRNWMSGVLRALPEGAADRTALHPERGEMTLRELLAYATWHLEHHAWYLHRKLAALDRAEG